MPAELRCESDEGLLVRLLHDADEDDARIRAALRDPAHSAYTVHTETECSGAVLMRWGEHDAEIVYISVIPEARGHGYGKAAIRAIADEARQRGVKTLWVGTGNSSLDTLAFYQKCGFRLDSVRHDFFAYLPTPVYEHGIRLRDLVMLRCILDEGEPLK